MIGSLFFPSSFDDGELGKKTSLAYVHPMLVVFIALTINYLIHEMNDYASVAFDHPGVGYVNLRFLIDFFWLLRMFGCDVVFYKSDSADLSLDVPMTELKLKLKNVYSDFIKTTRVLYLGCFQDIKLTNASGVLHPVDNFLKHFYDRYFIDECEEAFRTYKRTNPTLPMKLAELEKYSSPNVDYIPSPAIRACADELLIEIQQMKGFQSFATTLCNYVSHGSFDLLQIDPRSASGYPYPQGKKKRETQRDAVHTAYLMLNNDLYFEDYLRKHVWYSTGRAKLQSVDAPDSGRLILYGGHAYLLFALLALQPWACFMNCNFVWCGVGFSWMNNGAKFIAEYFGSDCGVAPAGMRFVSLDISGWDNKLHHDLLVEIADFFDRLFVVCGVDANYRCKFYKLYMNMIESTVAFPMGHLFKLLQGMKSGWASTANDNTLIHELVFRVIMKKIGFVKHILYGDDNIALVPIDVSDEFLIQSYAEFGLKVKVIHSSRVLSEVDFLSKRIRFKSGHYFPFRESVETHARLLMPEEMDPRRRLKPDPVCAVERVLGHLLDNPFNPNVRRICYKILVDLRDQYGIEYIEVHDELRRDHPWRNFDLERIPNKFPTVPDVGFLEALYGAPVFSDLSVVWPADVIPRRFDPNVLANDSTLYEVATDFSNEVQIRLSGLASRHSKSVVRKLSPYRQPKLCYGFHAARLEFAIKFFDISFSSLLDLGSHPGACAASGFKYCRDITCISKYPVVDVRGFCPYVARNAEIRLVEADADAYVPDRCFDLMHDDVDIVGARSVEEDITLSRAAIRRAFKNHKYVDSCLFTLREISSLVKQDLYDLYNLFGHIDFVKPHFSNPWKSEFLVYVQKKRSPRIRRSLFYRQFNAFLNCMADDILVWSRVLLEAISPFDGIEHVVTNPNASNKYEDEWLKPWPRYFSKTAPAFSLSQVVRVPTRFLHRKLKRCPNLAFGDRSFSDEELHNVRHNMVFFQHLRSTSCRKCD